MRFNNPEILYALLALLVPLIIHLFNFRRHKKILFSNVALLKNITIETKKQNKLKHLLVLLCRIFAFTFIVVAFAGPYFPKRTPVNVEKGISMIYLDNTFSMKAEGERGRIFDEALRNASELVKKSTKDQKFSISTCNTGANTRIKNKSEAELIISKTVIGNKRKKLSYIIKKQNRVSVKNNLSHNNIFLFSDFQKNQTDIQETPFDTTSFYYFFSYPHKTLHNLFIDSCWFGKPDLLPGKQVQLNVRVGNFSQSPVEKISVKLFVDGKQKSLAGCSVQPYGYTDVPLGFTIQNEGWHKGKVQIEDYPITFDDKLLFTFEVLNSIKVLEIFDNKPLEKDYLKTFFASDSVFEFYSATSLQLNKYRLSDFNFVVLNGVPEISSGLQDLLYGFVKSGGHLLIVPAAADNAFAINEFLKKFDAGKFTLLDTTPDRVVAIKENNQLFKNAIVKIPKNVDFPSVFKHYRLHYGFNQGVETLVSLLNGDDFVVSKNFGNGKIFVLSVPLNNEFSNFVNHPVFTVLFYGMATQGLHIQKPYYFLGVDNKITLNKNVPGNSDQALEIVTPENKKFIPAQNRGQGKLILSLQNGVNSEGFYKLMLKDSLFGIYAFNYNRKESETDFYNKRQLDSLLKISKIKHYKVSEDNKEVIKEIINTPQKRAFLWKLFIIFALFMLLAEILILRFWK